MAETNHGVSGKRRWKRFLFGALGMCVVLVLIYPLWLPWALEPMARRFGFSFQEYQRGGYARMTLRDVHWMSGPVSVSAGRVQLQMPHRWLGTRLRGAVSVEPQVTVQNWRLEIRATDKTSAGGIASTGELLDVMQSQWPSWNHWISSIVLTNGQVAFAGKTFPISNIVLAEEQFTVEALDSRAVLDLSSLATAELGLAVFHPLATAALELKHTDAHWEFVGGVDWQANHFQLAGSLAHADWFPAVATVDGEALRLRPALLGLEDFPDLQGRAHAVWTNGAYSFAIKLNHAPLATIVSEWQPISMQASGGGNLQTLRLDRLELVAPFLQASLDQPLQFDFAGSVEGRNTKLKLWADLSQIKAIDVAGQLSGLITVQPALHSPLRAGFDLRGTNIAGAGLQTQSIALAGRLDWPLLQMTNLTAEFASGGKLTSDFAVEMGGDARQGVPAGVTLAGWHLRDLSWKFEGPLPVTLPETMKLQSIHARGTAGGVWPDLAHQGTAEGEGLEVGVFRAAAGRLSWSGMGLTVEGVTARLEQGHSTIGLSGAGGVQSQDGDTQVELNCSALKLLTPDGVWELSQPFEFNLHRGTNGLALNLSPLELAGPASRLAVQGSVNWPGQGSGRIALQDMRSSAFREFLAPQLPELHVVQAAFSFGWDHGPLVFDLDAEAQWQADSNQVWSVVGRAKSDGASLRLDSLRVDLNGDACSELTGWLPLRVEPAAGWSVQATDLNEVAHFDLRVEEEGPLWSFVEQKAGVRIAAPKIQLGARGTLSELKADLVFNAAQVRLLQTNAGSAFWVPAVENVRCEASVGLSGIELRHASGEVLGQEFQAQARWELAAQNWREWWSLLQAPDWQRLTGRLWMEDAQLSALSAVAPELMAPLGEVNLQVDLLPDLKLNGRLTITNGATRFLRPLGALRDVTVDLAFNGSEATIHTFTASLGGRLLKVTGDVAWRPDGDQQFDLQLTGENLSLVRDPELFVRADLDLHLRKSFAEVARLTGEVRLQRSLLFMDFNALMGFDRDRPEQRPPYFSIPQPPFGDWQIDVRVRGDRFLGVFSPAFRGEVSAGLQLLGTLREPFAVGAVTVDSGRILFPFGTLQIENGRVDLMREDPYRPRLEFRGQGENFGYTVTVNLQGPLDAPNLTFQSVPPLNAQQILMMLTAGEIPRSDFGYSTTDKASKVGLFLGRDFVNRFIGNTSTSERLTLRSGEQITDDGKPTHSLEYQLSDRWSAFGEYNRFRDFNSGVKFKLLSK